MYRISLFSLLAAATSFLPLRPLHSHSGYGVMRHRRVPWPARVITAILVFAAVKVADRWERVIAAPGNSTPCRGPACFHHPYR